MKTIGFIDHFLDEWHAENYPRWIRESSFGDRYEVRSAWAETEPAQGRSNQSWCADHGILWRDSLEAVIEESDCLVVLAPDHPGRHEDLARAALTSGKPTYIDKTFAPSLAAARRIFAWADRHDTPVFSSSALRFARELDDAREKISGSLHFVTTGGGGTFDSYAVHQAEMLVALLDAPAQRVRLTGPPQARGAQVDFGLGREGALQVIKGGPFRVSAVGENGETYHCPQISAGFFPRFIEAMLGFFETGTHPFERWQTEAVMALLEAAQAAGKRPGEWVKVEAVPGHE